jgi:hypothetical protein
MKHLHSQQTDKNTAGAPPQNTTTHQPAKQALPPSTGQPLDTGTRANMEAHFGHDFSRVRIHTDAEAAHSTESMKAVAYTVGSDIVFGHGQYAPQTAQGQWLIAHELTHVVQQRDVPVGVQPLAIEPVGSLAEHEADRAASAALIGQRAPTITSHPQPAIRRTVAGGIFGGLLGAGVGIALGSLLGPIGMIVGGLLGAVAGLALGDIASSDERPLNDKERGEAELVFGKSMNYDRVRMMEAPIMSIGKMARTPGNTIYFPPGTFKEPFGDFMPWLIHELTHVWQTQHGISVFEKLFWALHGKSAYNYGKEEGLRSALAQGRHFSDFQTEQQGDICRDYYIKLKTGQDTSLYDPFIAEVQAGKSLNRPASDTSAAGATP